MAGVCAGVCVCAAPVVSVSGIEKCRAAAEGSWACTSHMEQVFGRLDFDGCTRLANQRPQARRSVSARTPFMSCSSACTPHTRKNVTTRDWCLMRTSLSLLWHGACHHTRAHAQDNEQHEQPRTADRSAHGHNCAAGSLRSCVRLVASGTQSPPRQTQPCATWQDGLSRCSANRLNCRGPLSTLP